VDVLAMLADVIVSHDEARERGAVSSQEGDELKIKNSDRAHHSSFGCGIEMFSSAQTRSGLTDPVDNYFSPQPMETGQRTLGTPRKHRNREMWRARCCTHCTALLS